MSIYSLSLVAMLVGLASGQFPQPQQPFPQQPFQQFQPQQPQFPQFQSQFGPATQDTMDFIQMNQNLDNPQFWRDRREREGNYLLTTVAIHQ